jgi:hypothetical protein
MRTPVFITSFNLLSPLRAMVEELRRLPDLFEPIIVDNSSSYAPLVEWLASEPCEIVRMPANFGPRAAWSDALCRQKMALAPFVVTDCDLDLSGGQLPFFKMCAEELLAINARLIKVGLALRIDDLPDTDLGRDARRHEAQFWARPYQTNIDGCEAFEAAIDTTWAMYRAASGWGGYAPAVRLVPPARHLPWYLDPENIPQEWEYSFRRINAVHTHWSARLQRAGER